MLLIVTGIKESWLYSISLRKCNPHLFARLTRLTSFWREKEDDVYMRREKENFVLVNEILILLLYVCVLFLAFSPA